MKTAACIILALACAGCTTTTYERTEHGVKFTRSSFGTKQSISEIDVQTNPQTGAQSLQVKGYSNEQTEIAAAVASSVAKALTPVK